MPELPDVEAYLAALRPRIMGERLEGIRLVGPSLLRTVDPSPTEAEGRRVEGLRRLGKRIVIALEGGIFLVLHLMVAGRLRWREPGAAVPRKVGLGAFDFPSGTLVLTEAGTRRRASLHLVRGEEGLAELDPGGVEVLGTGQEAFARALTRESHTLKRALTDPTLFSGIGNAYADEILHRARLSPFRRTGRLDPQEVGRLHRAAQSVLTEWRDRLLAELEGGRFPERVTAFREGMAVHGRHGEACPDCGAPVQRVVYAETETNYCPGCQTGGRILADRALSRLLKEDWPRTIEELEERSGG